ARPTSTPTARSPRPSRCTMRPATGGSTATTRTPTRRRGSPSASNRDGDRERPRAGARAGREVAGSCDAVAVLALENGVHAGAAVAVGELHRRAAGVGDVA